MSQTANSNIMAAKEFAAAGHYKAANDVLDFLGPENNSLDVFLLRAKMNAQQGNWTKAIEQWQEAIKLEPLNKEAQRGIMKVKQLQNSKISFMQLHLNLILIASGAIFLLSFVGWLYVMSSDDVSVLAKKVQVQQKQINQLNTDLESISSAIKGQSSPQALAIPKNQKGIKASDIAAGLQLPGIQVEVGNEVVHLKFDQGVFSGGTQISATATILLPLIAKVLVKYSNYIHVEIQGKTDDLPVPEVYQFKDNDELGMLRARSVMNYFVHRVNLPTDLFNTISLGPLNPQSSNKTEVDRAKNRTVEIHIKLQPQL